MVSVIVIEPKVRGLKYGRERLIFKGDKIRSTISFGGEVKPPVHVVRFCAMLKAAEEYDRATYS
jgi:hypothetical protein